MGVWDILTRKEERRRKLVSYVYKYQVLSPSHRNKPYFFFVCPIKIVHIHLWQYFSPSLLLYHLCPHHLLHNFNYFFLILSYFINYTFKFVSILNSLFLWDGGSITFYYPTNFSDFLGQHPFIFRVHVYHSDFLCKLVPHLHTPISSHIYKLFTVTFF